VKLRIRLAVSSALVTLAVAAAVGGYSLSVSTRTQLENVDESLVRAAAAVRADAETPLALALLLAKQDPNLTVLALIDADRQLTVLNGAPSKIPDEIARSVLDSAVRKPQYLSEKQVRISTVLLPDHEYIVFGVSVRTINDFRRENTKLLVQFALLAALLGGLLITIVTRFDLRRVERMIDVATAVADGAEDVSVPPARGSSEVAELSRALDQMVVTLRNNAASERATRVRMQEFLADASHELRTPLTVISGYLQLLQAQPDAQPEQRQRAMDRMSHESERMRALVSDLLLLAEVGAVSTPLAEEVDFSHMVVSAIGDLHALNESRTVDSMIAPRVVVTGVESHLQQLISNIFSNIEQHTPAHAPVRVRLWQVGGQIHLRVEDGGPGLPGLTQGKLAGDEIREFTRFDQSRSRETGGSGLGMSILAAIVREHQGVLSLSKSELGGLRMDIALKSTAADQSI
jgi:two-component system, OmpR family, sensor kinase